MFRRLLSRSRIGVAVMMLVAALTGTAAATAGTPAAIAPQALPSPSQFVSNLDLECFRTSPYTPPPLPAPLVLSHLNPVLAQQARWSVGTNLGPRTQLCVPVAKNGVIPPPAVLQFIRFVDLSCYRIPGPNLNLPLVLNHLNPQLGHLPRKEVIVGGAEQLCVPVIKNNVVPPAEVLSLVRFIDVACFRITPQVSLDFPLKLTQLNPVLTHLPTTEVGVLENRQLCVPVRKNDQQIPAPVLNIVRWIDFEKYDLKAPTVPTITLSLRHINPLLSGLPAEQATLLGPPQLALPVAKNGFLPPTT
jgi:hypothetical protein